MPQYRSNQLTNHHSRHISGLPHLLFARFSVPCERHPERNEDSILVDERTGLAGVFDGVGGSAAGQIASQTAARATSQGWRCVLEQLQTGHKRHTLLEHAETYPSYSILQNLIQAADDLVRTEGAQRAGTDDLATTVALAALCRKHGRRGYTMVYAHVGDSRIYLLQEHEPLKRLTNDDGLLAKLVQNEVVKDIDARRIDQAMHADQLSDTEFSYFRLRGGITQALGGPMPPEIHVDQVAVYPGDRVLLCTDGIHDNLTDEEIEAILRNSPRTSAARILVEHAIQRSHEERTVTLRAKPDDMSAIVMTCRF